MRADQAANELTEEQVLNFLVNTLDEEIDIELGENADIDFEDIWGVLVGATADEDVPDILGVDIGVLAEFDIDLLVESVDEKVKNLLFGEFVGCLVWSHQPTKQPVYLTRFVRY